jgi:hypothetical protein
MHPMLKTAVRRSWRDRSSLQFGVDPARAVVLEPLDEPAARFLTLLDGTRGPGLLREEAALLGLAPGRAERLLGTLADGGVLDDADSVARFGNAIRHRDEAIDRLRPDLASLSLVHPEPGAAAALMTARRAIRVQVRGAGRVGASVASVLAAAGVGVIAATIRVAWVLALGKPRERWRCGYGQGLFTAPSIALPSSLRAS